MNCQPNDRAFVVRDTAGDGCVSNLIGTPVVVDTSFRTFDDSHDAWTIRGAPLRCPSCGTVFIGLLDADLQPIRGQRTGTTDSRRIEKPEEVIA